MSPMLAPCESHALSIHVPSGLFPTYAGEDYYTHKAGGFFDLHNGTEPVLDESGVYSTELFANESIRIIQQHDSSIPFYLYLAFQSVRYIPISLHPSPTPPTRDDVHMPCSHGMSRTSRYTHLSKLLQTTSSSTHGSTTRLVALLRQ